MSIVVRCDGCGVTKDAVPSSWIADRVPGWVAVSLPGFSPRPRVHACSEACARVVAQKHRLVVLTRAKRYAEDRDPLFSMLPFTRRDGDVVTVEDQSLDGSDCGTTRWSVYGGAILDDGSRDAKAFVVNGWTLSFPA